MSYLYGRSVGARYPLADRLRERIPEFLFSCRDHRPQKARRIWRLYHNPPRDLRYESKACARVVRRKARCSTRAEPRCATREACAPCGSVGFRSRGRDLDTFSICKRVVRRKGSAQARCSTRAEPLCAPREACAPCGSVGFRSPPHCVIYSPREVPLAAQAPHEARGLRHHRQPHRPRQEAQARRRARRLATAASEPADASRRLAYGLYTLRA